MSTRTVRLFTPVDAKQATVIEAKDRLLPRLAEGSFVVFTTDYFLAANQARLNARTMPNAPFFVAGFTVNLEDLDPFKPDDWQVNQPITQYWVPIDELDDFSSLLKGRIDLRIV